MLRTMLPPLLADRPPLVQAVLAGLVPATFGAFVGLTLGWSAGVYLALQMVAALGGIGAGLEHSTLRSGAVRGLIGGVLFGAFLLIAHEVSGEPAELELAEPAVLLVVVTAVLGAAFGALGAFLRARQTPA